LAIPGVLARYLICDGIYWAGITYRFWLLPRIDIFDWLWRRLANSFAHHAHGGYNGTMRSKTTATKRKVVPGYDFSYLYPKYRGKWVALTRDAKRVLAVSDTLAGLDRDAGKALDDGKATVYRVPDTDAYFVGGYALFI